jgi:CRISPR-associated protein Cas2
MIVVVLSNCPNSLRGDLTLWLMEITTNVYVGNISARVRDNLWDRICDNIGNGNAVLAYTTNNEQGFDYRLCNSYSQIKDFDGLKLMLFPKKQVRTTYRENLPEEKEPNLLPGFSKASQFRKAKYFQNNKKNSDNLPEIIIHSSGIKIPRDFVILQIKTTGEHIKTDRIIEIAAVKYKNTEETEEFDFYINYEGKLPETIAENTGITDKILSEKGKSEKEVLLSFSDFTENLPIVSNSPVFDIDFLNKTAQKCDISLTFLKYYDIIKWSQNIVKKINNYKLQTLFDYFEIPYNHQIKAIESCKLLRHLMLKLLEI